MLNKKKKREESKELMKKGSDAQKKIPTKLNNFNQFGQPNNINSFDYQPYMTKSPYDMYYPPNFIDSLKSRSFPVDDQQLLYRMNSKI